METFKSNVRYKLHKGSSTLLQFTIEIDIPFVYIN